MKLEICLYFYIKSYIAESANNNMLETNFLNTLCTGDIERYINCLNAYKKINDDVKIEEVGYNSNSGYVYIYLDNGISICEAFNGVEYLVTNFENGDEFFFDEYEEAEEFNEWLLNGNEKNIENEKYQKALGY